MFDYLFVGLPKRDGFSSAYLAYGRAYAEGFAKMVASEVVMRSCSSYDSVPLWVTRLAPYLKDEFFSYHEVVDISFLVTVPLAAVYLVSCFTSNYVYAVVFALKMKARDPSCKVVLGGWHVSNSAAEEVQELGVFDCIVRGDGESFMELLGSIPLEGQIYDSSVMDLGLLPMPDYSVIDGNRSRYLDLPLITSRGCPYHCVYCLEGCQGYRQKYKWPFKVACTRSHCRAIRRALREGISHVAVFEDDALLLPGFDSIDVPCGTRLLLLGARPCQPREREWQGKDPCFRHRTLYVAFRSVFGDLLRVWSDETIEGDISWNEIEGVYFHAPVAVQRRGYSDIERRVI